MRKPATVDEYLSWVPADHRALLDSLRDAIRQAAPEAEETIAYGMPAYRLNGRFFVSYSDFKQHVSLFPASGLVREKLGDEIAPYVHGKGTFRFAADQPIPVELVKRIVRIRLEEVGASKGYSQ